jgi:subtilisin family serine protease
LSSTIGGVKILKIFNLLEIFAISLLSFVSFIEAAQSSSQPNEYVIDLPRQHQQLRFVRKPEWGYVVLSQDQSAQSGTLDGLLKEYQAKDVRHIGGSRRHGLAVAYGQRSSGENENIIKQLKTHNRVKYVAPLFSSNEETVAIIPEVVVRVSSGVSTGQIKSLCKKMNLTIKKKLEFTEREYLIEIPATEADDVFKATEQLKKADLIEWAAPNIAFRPRLLGITPDDEYFPNQWHLYNTGQSGGTAGADINAPAAWEITTGNPNIIVAVLDEGVDTDHPDLIDNIVPGYDFYDDDNSPDPTGNSAHGTACAGLIAAKGNNGIGVTGVAWNCKIMPIRIAGGTGFITDEEIATAIRWAANHGADILSNSWGSSSALPVIHSAIQDVTAPGGIGRYGKGCVVMAGAGNSGGSMLYPAIYDEVIAVGATNSNDVRWSYSSYGPALDIVAPSGYANLLGDIWTTDIAGSAGYNNRIPGILDYTDKMGGTSAACPIAAGTAALVLSVDPNLTNSDVQNTMQTTAKDLGDPGFDNYYGFGRVDAHAAVDLTSTLLSENNSEILWASRYIGPTGTDYAQALAVDNQGNVYVAGTSAGLDTLYDYATIKYDANGNQLWAARYNGPANGDDFATAMIIDNSGNVYITGHSTNTNGSADYLTIKYDTNGNQLWATRYNGPADSYDNAAGIALDNSGNVYVTGTSVGLGSSDDYATIKYDPDGNQLWVARYNGPANNADMAKAAAVDNWGNVYVTGSSNDAYGLSDFATVKYDSNGNQLWAQRYNGPGNDYDQPQAMAIDNAGNTIVTGSSYGDGPGNDYATVKYATDGSQLWVARYNGPGNDEDMPHSLAIDTSGSVYVTGESYGTGNDSDYATVKYDSDGAQLWVARYNGPANNYDTANALVLDASGNVYVTGSSVRYGSNSHYNYLTVKYNSNGAQLWVSRHDGSGYYSAAAIAVDSSENVYVTGSNTYCATGDNYVTIKYGRHNYCTQQLDGDLNYDCKVDFADLALFAQQWLTPLNFTDYVTLSNNWLECNLAYGESCW